MKARLPEAFCRAPLAHRGYHDRSAGRPENTPAAFRAAIAAGYGIELDLQLSADGEAMVFHDDALERLTGQDGLVRDLKRADLERLAVLGSAERVAALDEVLDLVAGRAPLLVEIKDQSLAYGPTDGRLERATARALAGYQGPVAVMSFNPHAVMHMAEIAPDLPRGLTTSSFGDYDIALAGEARCAELRAIPDYDRTGSHFLSHEAADLARPRVHELKAQGAAILCWTVRSPAEEEAARRTACNITFEGYAAPRPA